MASNTGTTILDFGIHPGSEYTSGYVLDSTISATAFTEIYLQGGTGVNEMLIVPGTNHTYKDHKQVAQFLAFPETTPDANYGFIYRAISTQKITGTFLVNWIWSD